MDMNVNRELIKELRLKNSWSQEKLADKAGVSLRTIQRIETDGIASLQTREAIANVFEISPNDLDIEQGAALTKKAVGKQFPAVFLASLKAIEEVLRSVFITIAVLLGTSLVIVASFKPFIPENVGLFTSETTTSFGIIGNTLDKQEHLGFWIIPIAIAGAWLMFKCVNVLSKSRIRT